MKKFSNKAETRRRWMAAMANAVEAKGFHIAINWNDALFFFFEGFTPEAAADRITIAR